MNVRKKVDAPGRLAAREVAKEPGRSARSGSEFYVSKRESQARSRLRSTLDAR
jgi:hypothetical protein